MSTPLSSTMTMFSFTMVESWRNGNFETNGWIKPCVWAQCTNVTDRDRQTDRRNKQTNDGTVTATAIDEIAF